MDQAKEQIRQLIQQGTDLRAKNERLEQEKTAGEATHKEEAEEGHNNSPDNQVTKQPRNGIRNYLSHWQIPRAFMLAGVVAVMWLGILFGKYIM